MKKNKIILASTVAAFSVLSIGAFAFFSDKTDANLEGEVGTVKVNKTEGHDMNLGLTNHENINPGDEKNPDPETPPYDPEDPKKTTPHELSFSVYNDGTKSIRTRNVIEIEVTNSNGDSFLDPRFFAICEKNLNTHINTDIDKTDLKVEKTVLDRDGHKVLRYVIEGASLNGQSGKLEDKDIVADDVNRDSVTTDEAVNSATYKYYLSMIGDPKDIPADMLPSDSADAVNELFNSYQAAKVRIKVEVQAMQYRNTIEDDWKTVMSDSITTD